MAEEHSQFQGVFGYTTAVDGFYEFLFDTGQYFRIAPERRGHLIPINCLLDVMYIWLIDGWGFSFCPTHDAFLIAAIEIAQSALDQEPDLEPSHIFVDGTPMWRGKELPLLPKNEDGNTLSHPLLSRRMFDSVKEQTASELLIRIRQRLDDLALQQGITYSEF